MLDIKQEIIRNPLSLNDKQKDRLVADARKLAERVERTYHDLGRVLYRIAASKAYKKHGYDSHEEFVQEELGYAPSKAEYLMRIWYRLEHGFSEEARTEIVERLGITKARTLVSVMDEDNYEDWLDKADRLSTRDLVKAVRVAKGLVSDPSETLSEEFRCKLSKDQMENVDAALQLAARMSDRNPDVKGSLLDLVATDFLASNSSATSMKRKLREWMKRIERAAHVTLRTDADPNEMEPVLADIIKGDPAAIRKKIGSDSKGPLTAKELLVYWRRFAVEKKPSADAIGVDFDEVEFGDAA